MHQKISSAKWQPLCPGVPRGRGGGGAVLRGWVKPVTITHAASLLKMYYYYSLNVHTLRKWHLQNLSTALEYSMVRNDNCPSFLSFVPCLWIIRPLSYLIQHPCAFLLWCAPLCAILIKEGIFVSITTDPRGPFYWHGLTFSPARLCNHMPMKGCDKIT